MKILIISNMKVLLAYLLVIISTLIFYAVASADEVPLNNCKISALRVHNLTLLTKEEFLDIFDLHINEVVDREKINSAIIAAFQKGLFKDIGVDATPLSTDWGCSTSLDIKVVERDIIGSIEINGLSRLGRGQIIDALPLKEGMPYYEASIQNAISILKQRLADKGFPDAEIEIKHKNTTGIYVDIIINIRENRPLIINEIIINKDISQSKLKSLGGFSLDLYNMLDIKKGIVYDKDVIDARIAEFRNQLKEKGYFRPIISKEYSPYTGQLIIDVEIGERLRTTINGNNNFLKFAFYNRNLIKEMSFYDVENITQGVIDESIEKMKRLYHREGYPNVSIECTVKRDDTDIELIFNIREDSYYLLSRIDFHGNTFKKSDLIDAIPMKEWSDFNPNLIKESEEALKNYYKGQGFTNVFISDFRVNVNKELKRVYIGIDIDEGKRTIIDKIEITGNKKISTEDIRESLDIRPGEFYNKDNILNSKYIITTLYRRIGYADVAVAMEEVLNDNRARIIYHITEGKRYLFGHTIIKGNYFTGYDVFKRAITHRLGNVYDYNILLNEVMILNRTGLFKTVNIVVIDRADNYKDIVFEVEESNRWILEFGLGYGELEGPRGFMDIGYRNIFGGNRQLRLRAEASEIYQLYSLNYLEPWFLYTPYSFKAIISYNHRKQINLDTRKFIYTYDKYTASAGIGRPLARNLKADISYEISFINTYDVLQDIILTKEFTPTVIISSIIPSLTYDTRDNPFNPKTGMLTGVSIKIASRYFFSQTDFVKVNGNIMYFNNIFRNVVLAVSLKAGVAEGLGASTSLPLIERFFLGGMNTIRGFLLDQVGPAGQTGIPLGGNIFILGNVETRIEIGYGFGCVLFYDGGNVWSNISDINLSVIRSSLGTGIRYMTPVGPIRLDYGYKLQRYPGESLGEFHFSLGEAF